MRCIWSVYRFNPTMFMAKAIKCFMIDIFKYSVYTNTSIVCFMVIKDISIRSLPKRIIFYLCLMTNISCLICNMSVDMSEQYFKLSCFWLTLVILSGNISCEYGDKINDSMTQWLMWIFPLNPWSQYCKIKKNPANIDVWASLFAAGYMAYRVHW
jgi:hypothetical protein